MAKSSNAVLVTETEVLPIIVTETEKVVETPVTETVVYDMVVLMAAHKTKSGVIRHLGGLGLTRSEILKVMKTMYPNFLYQHVRNVLITPLKKSI